MAKLFGIDIAAVVTSEIRGTGGLRPGTLTKTTPGTRTAGTLTDGTNPTTTTHTFDGFVDQRESRRGGQLGTSSMGVVTILGVSVSPVAVPEVNDSVVIDGVTYLLTELLTRDPAEAVYEFRASS